MIQNKIHYIWIGKELDVLGSELRRKCFKSVHDYCKKNDTLFTLWTDDDFNDIINNNKYLSYLYNNRLYGIVADYFKYYVVYHNGGIYMDTDVEISIDFPQSFLETNDYFIPSQTTQFTNSSTVLNAGFIGVRKGSELIKMVLDYYDNDLFNISNPTMENVYMDCAITSEVFKDFRLQTTIPSDDNFNEQESLNNKVINCIHQECVRYDIPRFYMRHYFELSWNVNQPIMWRVCNAKS